MSETASANLALPYLAAAQAQKHVTHNEALTVLDTLVQLACLTKGLAAPPASPFEGARYLIHTAAPTGAWAGWAGRIARFQDGAWISFVPRPGWLAYVIDEADLYTYAGGAWLSFRATLTVLQNLTRLGIGTTADAANPFAAKLNTALWTALGTAEGGTGDLRYTLNKQAAGNVLSLLFQSGFSGRAELGLNGSDDLSVKVSSDGSAFREALRINRTTGAATFGGTVAHVSDNAFSFGTAPLRASVVYAATGTINTSDAREKTPLAPLTDAQVAAAVTLAGEIGTFRFLEAVARKGDAARVHVGLTVQRVIAVLTAEGLDPFAFGLVCHDTWPAIEATPDAPGMPAGDRYGLRTDELLLFLARGFDARLSALERPAARPRRKARAATA